MKGFDCGDESSRNSKATTTSRITKRAAESEECDTAELCQRVRARRGPQLISTHSLLLLLQPSLEKETANPDISNIHPVIDTLTRGMNTSARAVLQEASGQRLFAPDPLSCRAIFIPVQPLCSSTCHLHSELPAADPLTAAQREGSHNNNNNSSSSSSSAGGASAIDCVKDGASRGSGRVHPSTSGVFLPVVEKGQGAVVAAGGAEGTMWRGASIWADPGGVWLTPSPTRPCSGRTPPESAGLDVSRAWRILTCIQDRQNQSMENAADDGHEGQTARYPECIPHRRLREVGVSEVSSNQDVLRNIDIGPFLLV
ncbi:unnamed protein product [Pleuronectes platessa]|uniref:Uncharacterized protein n=1 Tax=Pleuronectes platessa TaxID=8262 RepID=A0A9N7TJA6_PLEPL|nr:unnamed protein product [Pleuronectes platessa]